MATSSRDEFPRPRSGAIVFVYNHQLMVWGGMTQIILGEGNDRFLVQIDLPDTDAEGPVLEILDLESYQWRRQETDGEIPNNGRSSFHVIIDNHLYLFGGNNDNGYCNKLYKLDLNKYKWIELSDRPNSPPPMALGGTVSYNGTLILFGGVGLEFRHSPYGATFEWSQSFGYIFEHGWNNYLMEYDPGSEHWRELNCSGHRPPPSSRFTFNKIDRSHALLFGGKQEKYTVTYDHVFILDMDTREWSGPFKPVQDEKWPCARGLHAATCLVDPESKIAEEEQYVIVVWGQGVDAKHVPDIWILHVQSMKWKEFIVPSILRPRMFHMCCSDHLQDKQTDVIIYGGNKQRQSKFDRNVITSPVIIRFGSVQRLDEQCIQCLQSNMDYVEPMLNMLPPPLKLKVIHYQENCELTIIYPLEANFKC